MCSINMSSFKLNVPAFIASLCIGLLYVYVATPHRQVVVRRPTPENAGSVVYEDDHSNCFVMDAKKVEC